MQVKTSKTLLNFIKKNIQTQDKFNGYNLELCHMDKYNYLYYTGEQPFYNSDDYNLKLDKFNIFKVKYPQDFYCYNLYITTNDLKKIYRKSDKTVQGFLQSFYDFIEV